MLSKVPVSVATKQRMSDSRPQKLTCNSLRIHYVFEVGLLLLSVESKLCFCNCRQSTTVTSAINLTSAPKSQTHRVTGSAVTYRSRNEDSNKAKSSATRKVSIHLHLTTVPLGALATMVLFPTEREEQNPSRQTISTRISECPWVCSILCVF